MEKWFVYLLGCSDGSLYCGIAKDVEKRLQSHVAGAGAKYTKGRGPFKLLYVEECADHQAAAKREAEIKRWPRTKKLNLVELDYRKK